MRRSECFAILPTSKNSYNKSCCYYYKNSLLFEQARYYYFTTLTLLSISSRHQSWSEFTNKEQEQQQEEQQQTRPSDLQRLQQQIRSRAFAQYVVRQNAPFIGATSKASSSSVSSLSSSNINIHESGKQEYVSHQEQLARNNYLHNVTSMHNNDHKNNNNSNNSKKQFNNNMNTTNISVRGRHINEEDYRTESKQHDMLTWDVKPTQSSQESKTNYQVNKRAKNNNAYLPQYKQEERMVKHLHKTVVAPQVAINARNHCFAELCKTVRIVHDVKIALMNITQKRKIEQEQQHCEEQRRRYESSQEIQNNNNSTNSNESRVEVLLNTERRRDYEAIIRERVLQLQSTLRQFMPLIENNKENNRSSYLRINDVWIIKDNDITSILSRNNNNNDNNNNTKARNNKTSGTESLYNTNINNKERYCNVSYLPERTSYTVKQLFYRLVRDLYSVYQYLNSYTHSNISLYMYRNNKIMNRQAQQAYVNTSGALYGLRVLIKELVSADIANSLRVWTEESTVPSSTNQREQENNRNHTKYYYYYEELAKGAKYRNNNNNNNNNNSVKLHLSDSNVKSLTFAQMFQLFKMCVRVPANELPLFTIEEPNQILSYITFNKLYNINKNNKEKMEHERSMSEREIKYLFHAITCKPFTCEEWLLLRWIMLPTSSLFSNSYAPTQIKGTKRASLANNNENNHFNKKENVKRQYYKQLFRVLRLCMSSESANSNNNSSRAINKNFLAHPSFVHHDEYSAAKHINREDLRIPFHLGAAFATKLLTGLLLDKTTSDSKCINNSNNNNSCERDKETITEEELCSSSSYSNNNDNNSSSITREHTCEIGKHDAHRYTSNLSCLSVNDIALLCSAILFYELYTLNALHVLIAAAPRLVREVELLSGVEVATVMMSFAKLNYSGNMNYNNDNDNNNCSSNDDDSTKEAKDKEKEINCNENMNNNFYVVLGNHAARLGESLSASDISLIVSALESVHVEHDLLRSCFESMLRTRHVFS